MRTVASLDVRDQRGRVLLVSKDGKVWHLPGGERERRETYLQALTRELVEELHLRLRGKLERKELKIYPSRDGTPTRYGIFTCTRKDLQGKPRLNRKDPIKFFEWMKNPLKRKLNPCTRAILKRNGK
jgi:8-oxo-dGTP pyrophosphatase MutT (NUDIX family)